MAVELAPKNIRVNAINPVIGETGMLTHFMGLPDTPENRAKFLAGIPLGRMSQPHDIANAALFLADPASELHHRRRPRGRRRPLCVDFQGPAARVVTGRPAPHNRPGRLAADASLANRVRSGRKQP